MSPKLRSLLTSFRRVWHIIRQAEEGLVACHQFTPDENRRRRIFNEIMLVFGSLGLFTAGQAATWDAGRVALWAELQPGFQGHLVLGGLALAGVSMGLWGLNRQGRVPMPWLGYGFTLVLAILIGVITQPEVLNDSSSLFFLVSPSLLPVC